MADIKIVFHVIIDLDMWEWQEGAEITLEFHPRLKNVETDFLPVREFQCKDHPRMALMESTICVPAHSVTNGGIAYNYCMYVHTATTQQPVRECIDFGPGFLSFSSEVYRFYRIPEGILPNVGMCHCYGTVIVPITYPKELPQDNIRRIAIKEFLDAPKKDFNSNPYSPRQFEEYIRTIIDVYTQVADHLVMFPRSKKVEMWKNKASPKIIMEWVEDIVEQSSSDSRYNLLTGFVAAAIIQAVFEKEGMKNLQYISDEYAIKVMEMLRLNSAQDEMQYSALDVVSKKVPDEIRKMTCEGIYKIRNFTAVRKKWETDVWIVGSATVHFLYHKIKPFDQSMPPSFLQCVMEEMNLRDFKQVREAPPPEGISCFGKYIPVALAYAEADPIILATFLAAAPVNEINHDKEKLNCFPLYMLLLWTKKVIVEDQSLQLLRYWSSTGKEAWQNCESPYYKYYTCFTRFSRFFSNLKQMSHFLENLQKSLMSPIKNEECSWAIEATQKLFDSIMELKKNNDVKQNCICSVIMFTLNLMNSVAEGDSDHYYMKIKRFLEGKIKALIDQRTSCQDSFSADAPKEVKVWIDLLTGVKISPMPIAEEWEDMCSSLVKYRIDGLTSKKQKMEILRGIQAHCDNCPDFLKETIMLEVTSAYKDASQNDASTTKKKLMELMKQPSKLLGEVIGCIVIERHSRNGAMLEDLLEWIIWPSCLEANRNAVIKPGMPLEAKTIMDQCVKLLTHLSEAIKQGDVTTRELALLAHRRLQWKSLYCQLPNLRESDKQLSLERATDQRLQELNHFNMSRENLNVLCRHIYHKEHISGMKEIDDEVKMEYNEMKINSLCHTNKSREITLLAFKNAHPVMVFLKEFHIMAEEKKNVLFSGIWMEVLESAGQISLDDLDIVWIKAFYQSIQLRRKLQKMTIEFQEIKKMFSSHRRKNEIKKALECFATGIETCFITKNIIYELQRVNPDICNIQKTPEIKDILSSGVKVQTPSTIVDMPWIKETAEKIEDYWTICCSVDTANILLKLKDNLKLCDRSSVSEHVTFTSIQRLHVQGKNVHEPKGLLRNLERDVVEVAKNLNVEEDGVECFKELVKYWVIVDWTKKNFKDFQDLCTFDEIATSTIIDEDVMLVDKIHNLRTVVGAFRTVIFGTLRTYNDLKEAINYTSNYKRDNTNLLEILTLCAGMLDWYGKVKVESETTVKARTDREMSDIRKFGVWKIGDSKEENYSTISKAVLLIIPGETEHGEPKKRYNSNELQELQSRFLLTTKTEEKNKELARTFSEELNVIHTIAKQLIHLQSAGNTKYFGWSATFKCRNVSVDILKGHMESLSRELKEWKDRVDVMRQNHTSLNSFTDIQLCSLRQEFIKAKHKRRCELRNSPKSLLWAFSFAIKNEKVWEIAYTALQTIPTQIEQEESEDMLLSMPCTISKNAPPKAEPSRENDDPEQKKLRESYRETYGMSHDETLKEAVQRFGENKAKVIEYYEQNIPQSDSLSQSSETSYDSITINSLQIHSTGDHLAMTLRDRIKQSEHVVETSLSTAATVVSGAPVVEEGVRICAASNADYLTLPEMAAVLDALHKEYFVPRELRREFPEGQFDVGQPNLIIVEPGKTYAAALSLYKLNRDLPLPTVHEILPCTSQTSYEQAEYTEASTIDRLKDHSQIAMKIDLLWRRALQDSEKGHIFCLLNAQELSYAVSEEACTSLLTKIGETKNKKYRLVIVCTETDATVHMTSRLHRFIKKLPEQCYDSEQVSLYLNNHFQTSATVFATTSESKRSHVCLVKSKRAGMGKTLWIKRKAQSLRKKVKALESRRNYDCIVAVPVNGPSLLVDEIVNILCHNISYGSEETLIFHLDITASMLQQVDTLLFEMAILCSLTGESGKTWKRHPSQFLAIECTEDANAISQFMGLLPSYVCKSPIESLYMLIKDTGKSVIDEQEFNSDEFRNVYRFLKDYDRAYCHKTVPTKQSVLSHRQTYMQQDWLECILRFYGDIQVKNPSWREVNYFVKFLFYQLKDCETSVFLKDTSIRGFKEFAVKFMVQMSRDFATSTLEGEVSLEESNQEEFRYVEGLQIYHIVERKKWETRVHPYLFFNEDHHTFTFANICIKDGNLLDPDKRHVVLKQGIASKDLMALLAENGVNFSENYKDWTRKDIIGKLTNFLGFKEAHDPDPSYALNVDNFVKMLAILVRFRCGIPVVIMGETGCGKTRLIRYMCDFLKQNRNSQNLFILKVHGGTTKEDIQQFVEVKTANQSSQTVIFFDEANTTDAVGMIKEIMCDGKVNGKPIASMHTNFIAACNPYKRHTKDMILKLESAGLGYFTDSSSQTERIGNVPLRHLVYRVHDLPPSMRPLVYDFGQLPGEREKDYVRQIVCNCTKRTGKTDLVKGNKETFAVKLTESLDVVAYTLFMSQVFMRREKSECSFVSLRDIKRSMKVLEYFFKQLPVIQSLIKKHKLQKMEPSIEQKRTDNLVRSLILTLGVCYLPRLQAYHKREAFIQNTVRQMRLRGGVQQFKEEINWYQHILLGSMHLDDNTATNEALRENVFMMVTSIELRLPLFVIGKPGSSKSLSKSIILKSMLGQDSEHPLMKIFKQVRMISYQCSPLSNSETIIEVFDRAKQLQNKRDPRKFVAVVVLDEVGLAEDSPHLPLKSLHPLLEDGTGDEQCTEENDTVAFLGISNWALDPAKMNRGMMVSRVEPTTEELVLSARSICSNKDNDPVRNVLEQYLRGFAEGYTHICKRAEAIDRKYFFGLRDFYSTIKMLYWMCEQSDTTINKKQIEHVILRNFGGLEGVNAIHFFKNRVIIRDQEPTADDCLQKPPFTNPNNSQMGIIKANINTEGTSWHREARYLLLITSAPLPSIQVLLSQCLKGAPPLTIFGSGFPRDDNISKVCHDISTIKLCMETGKTVVLWNLDTLYASLYDLLNQYFINYGGYRYIDLGLQNHKVRCRVDKKFRLILVATKETVYHQFPMPLLNRMEKHLVHTHSMLNSDQSQIHRQLQSWVKDFSITSESSSTHVFKEDEAFIGFQEETCASVVLDVYECLKTEDCLGGSERNETVLNECQMRLLQIASPESLIRLTKTKLRGESKQLSKIFFTDQKHDSLISLLQWSLLQKHHFLQVTTYSRLFTEEEFPTIQSSLQLENEVAHHMLQEFDTEYSFEQAIREDAKSKTSFLIIQCYAGRHNATLIPFARFKIPHLLQSNERESKIPLTTVFLIHIPRGNINNMYIGYQGHPWLSVHIDDVHGCDIRPDIALTKTIGKTLRSDSDIEYQASEQVYRRFYNCLHEAISRIQLDPNRQRKVELVSILMLLFSKDSGRGLEHSVQEFQRNIISHLIMAVNERDETMPQSEDWVLRLAFDPVKLENGPSFNRAICREIEGAIRPLFSKMIFFIDQNCNLDLVNPDKRQPSCVRNLWNRIFTTIKISNFGYVQLVEGGYQYLSPSAWNYKVEFPFHNHVKTIVEQEWERAKVVFENLNDRRHTVEGCKQYYRQLCTNLKNTKLHGVLSEVLADDCHELAKRYRKDFVCCICPQHEQRIIFEIIYKSLELKSQDLMESQETNLLQCIAAYHVAYHMCDTQIFWITHLLSMFPDDKLEEFQEFSKTNLELSMALPKRTVEWILLCLSPSFEGDKSNILTELSYWLNRLYQLQSGLGAIFELIPDSKRDPSWQKWQGLHLVQLFIDYVVLVVGEHMIPYGKRLQLILESTPDLTSIESVKRLQRYINEIDTDLGTRIDKRDKQLVGDIRKQFNMFYLEVLSSICFNRSSHNTGLERLLTDSVFKVKGTIYTTKPLWPYRSGGDRVPTIRSTLLQLLICHSDKSEHLQYFMDKTQELIGKIMTDKEWLDFCVFFITCFEDSHVLKTLSLCAEEQIASALTSLEKVYCVLKEYDIKSNVFSYDIIEAIATMRFSLRMIGNDLIHHKYLTRTDKVVKTVLSDMSLNTLETGPSIYILRIIVRRFGYTQLMNVMKEYPWIVPDHLKTSFKEKASMDPFTVYEDYANIKKQMFMVLGEEDIASVDIIVTKKRETMIMCAGALCSAGLSSTHIIDGKLKSLMQLWQSSHVWSHTIKQFVGSIGRTYLSKLCDSGLLNKSILFPLIVHSTAVILLRQSENYLHPFLKVITQPASLKHLHIPGMPENSMAFVSEVLRASLNDVEGKYYSCPKGHPYFIGNCGRPWVSSVCPVCKSSIGGKQHKSAKGNISMSQAATQSVTGYTLEFPDKRSLEPSAERNTPPVCICILRAVLHCLLIWTCCNQKNLCTDVIELTGHSSINVFWKQLNHDLEMLAKCIRKGLEEASLLVHLVLKNICTAILPKEKIPLTTEKDLTEWEGIFSKLFVQPEMTGIEEKIQKTVQVAIENDPLGQEMLLRTIYEMSVHREMNSYAHFWLYSSPTTLHDVLHYCHFKSTPQAHPILFNFLKQEVQLRATQYIADIAFLQQHLYNKYNCKLTHKTASSISIYDALIKDDNLSDNHKEKLVKCLKSLSTAWKLCRRSMECEARFPLEVEVMQCELTDDQPLEFIIPTTYGRGACTTALIDYLVRVHNGFVITCSDVMGKYHKRKGKWQPPTVPILHIHSCHLLVYEDTLGIEILSYCQKSLRIGKGLETKYNLNALEKHLVTKYIAGKPLIGLEIPHVLYHSDVYTVESFATIMRTVHPQEELKRSQRECIKKEEYPRIRLMLDTVTTVLGFLGSSETDANVLFRDYLQDVLQIDCDFPPPLQFCKIGYVLSLWKALSVEIAKRLSVKNEDAFKTFGDQFKKTMTITRVEVALKKWKPSEVDEALEVLYEFIELHLKYIMEESCDSNQRLLGDDCHLPAYLERWGKNLPDQFNDLPQNLSIGQTIELWKQIALFLHKQEQELRT